MATWKSELIPPDHRDCIRSECIQGGVRREWATTSPRIRSLAVGFDILFC